MPTKKRIAKFQALYRNRFGEEIGTEEAREKGMALVRFLTIITKPMNKEEFQELKQRNNINS